jgi:hypothetical protein
MNAHLSHTGDMIRAQWLALNARHCFLRVKFPTHTQPFILIYWDVVIICEYTMHVLRHVA